MSLRRNLAAFVILILLAVWLGTPAPSPAASVALQVKGSDTIGTGGLATSSQPLGTRI